MGFARRRREGIRISRVFFWPTTSLETKLVSLNVRGLSNFRKRRAIFTWCRKQKTDLIFLQETHSTKAGEYKWKKEWGSEIIFSHGSSDSKGVAVLIKRGLDIVVEQELQNSNGRSIILKTLIKDKKYLLANIFMVLTKTQTQFDSTKICRQHYEKWILVVMTTLL